MEELNIGHTIIIKCRFSRSRASSPRDETSDARRVLSFATDDEDANLLLRSGKSTLSARRRTTEEVLSERTRHYHEKKKRN